MNALRRMFRRPDPPEIDLRACIGTRDPVDWFQRAKLDKRTRYVMAKRDREIARANAVLEQRAEAELLDPDPEFDDWRDAAAFDAGVPRHGEI